MILIFAIIAFGALAGALFFALEHSRPYQLDDYEDWDITDLIARWRR